MTEAEQLLEALVQALEEAYISSWQSTAHWDDQLNAAKEYILKIRERETKEPYSL